MPEAQTVQCGDEVPVAVLMSPGGSVPLVFANDDAELLLVQLRATHWLPAIPVVESARQLLRSLPEPYGWFDQLEDLSAHLESVSTDQNAELPVGSITGLSLLELLI